MKIVRPVALDEVLDAWGRHEVAGRFLDDRRYVTDAEARIMRAGGPEADRIATQLIRELRAPLIEHIRLWMTVRGCWSVEFSAEDIPRIAAMTGHDEPRRPLREDTASRAAGNDEDNDWTRARMVDDEPVTGPLIAVARSVSGPFTLADGNHRAAVWCAHAERGLNYSISAHVIATERPASFEGC